MNGSELDPAAELLDLAYRSLALKDVPRAGWVLRGVTNPESVADHSWGTALLCLLFAPAAGVDRDRAVSMALLHDLPEVETGDIAALIDERQRTIGPAEKSRLEHAAIEDLIPTAASSLRALWDDYEQRSSDVASFVRDMNLLDMCLQALFYEEAGRASAGAATEGGRLEEFFESARRNVSTPLGTRLFSMVEARYRAARGGGSGPLS